MKPGKLIIIEAIDGGGKDTQADLLVGEYGCIKTRLPIYEYESGKLLRKYIDSGKANVTEEVFQSIMMANYIEHLQTFILPLVRKGENVVMTRFLPSMWAYGNSFDIDVKYLKDLMQTIYDMYVREIGVLNLEEIFIRIPVDTGIRRINKRAAMGGQKVEGVFENRETLTKVAGFYEKHPFTYIVDGERKIEEVHSEISNYLKLN